MEVHHSDASETLGYTHVATTPTVYKYVVHYCPLTFQRQRQHVKSGGAWRSGIGGLYTIILNASGIGY